MLELFYTVGSITAGLSIGLFACEYFSRKNQVLARSLYPVTGYLPAQPPLLRQQLAHAKDASKQATEIYYQVKEMSKRATVIDQELRCRLTNIMRDMEKLDRPESQDLQERFYILQQRGAIDPVDLHDLLKEIVACTERRSTLPLSRNACALTPQEKEFLGILEKFSPGGEPQLANFLERNVSTFINLEGVEPGVSMENLREEDLLFLSQVGKAIQQGFFSAG